MTKPKVLVFGSSGCLGSALIKELTSNGNPYVATYNSQSPKSTSNLHKFSVGDNLSLLLKNANPNIVVNCIVIKKGNLTSPKSYLRLLRVNSLFPLQLARLLKNFNIPLINISTDTVFNGAKGSYQETSTTIPRSVYALSKRLGESKLKNVHNIRLSFVPKNFPNAKKHNALAWLINATEAQPAFGFQNHFWNGLTDEITAKALVSIINEKSLLNELPKTLHLYSRKVISKFELAELILNRYLLPTNTLRKANARCEKNLSLSSSHVNYLLKLWAALGFTNIPNFEDLF
jgi:dTDP-4-dehydrorhamnose reductase